MKSCFCFLLALVALTVSTQAQAPLRPGDTIELRISGVPSDEIGKVSSPYTVDTDGMINLAYIGKVRALGLTAGQLQTSIENRYKADQIFTNPTIMISQAGSARFVNVGGDVRSPSRVPYTPDLTLLKAIIAVGGFSDYARETKVKLLRRGEVMIIDVKKIRKNPALDIKLLPGDDIFVPQSIW